ncbi:MAG: hypothetical protein ACRELA_03030, partial [Candidatus Rokuibacteriota bacterium]
GVVGTDRAVTIRDVARTAFQVARLPPGLEPGLYETGTFSPRAGVGPALDRLVYGLRHPAC